MSSNSSMTIMSYNILADVWIHYTKVNDLFEKSAEIALQMGKYDQASNHPIIVQLSEERESLINEKQRCIRIAAAVRKHMPNLLLLQEAQESSIEYISEHLSKHGYELICFSANKVSSNPTPTGTASFVLSNGNNNNNNNNISINMMDDVWLECGSVKDGSDGATAQLLGVYSNNNNKHPIAIIANIHLDYGYTCMSSQLQVLRGEIVKKLYRDIPLVIVGDYNATRDEVGPCLAETGFGLLVSGMMDKEPNTFFSFNTQQTRQCDHIYASPSIKISNVLVDGSGVDDIKTCMSEFGSDHIPLVATLAF